jgi:8-oxo-dGTP diphosphatase
MAIPDYLRNIRTKIGHNLVYMSGVMAVVLNDANEVLIQRRKDNGKLGLPGGIMEPGEEPVPATIREVLEETGVEVVVDRIIAVYAGRDQLVVYPNNDTVFFIQFVLVCRQIGGSARINDDESLEVCYVPLAELPEMERSQSDYVRLAFTSRPDADFRSIRTNAQEKEFRLMAISEYVKNIRAKIGNDLLLIPGAVGVIVNEQGQILLQHRSDNGKWGLPGGAIDPGEEPADAVIREIKEETGLDVIPERIVGVYSGPDYQITYPNGDEAVIISICFACRPFPGQEPQVNDDESLDVRYFAPDALPSNMDARNIQRIQQALRNDPRTHFRMNSA